MIQARQFESSTKSALVISLTGDQNDPPKRIRMDEIEVTDTHLPIRLVRHGFASLTTGGFLAYHESHSDALFSFLLPDDKKYR